MAEARHSETKDVPQQQQQQRSSSDSNAGRGGGLHPVVAPHRETWHDHYPADLAEHEEKGMPANRPGVERKLTESGE